MKTTYKGYEIEVSREKCLGGWSQIYYNVYRQSDGLEVICSFMDSEDSVRDIVKCMKDRVDRFIETRGDSEELKAEFENG